MQIETSGTLPVYPTPTGTTGTGAEYSRLDQLLDAQYDAAFVLASTLKKFSGTPNQAVKDIATAFAVTVDKIVTVEAQIRHR